MDDGRHERAHHAGQWAGIGVFAVYLFIAWAGIELLSRSVGR